MKKILDGFVNLYPTIRKVEGQLISNHNYSWLAGRTRTDIIVFRLAETYLLRAEAYLKNSEIENAVKDINKIRMRANAPLITTNDMSIDFLLDERARELIVEEPRRRILMRMGKLVERTRKYNMRPSTRNTIQEHHELYPIPQSVIDANFSVKIQQNPGY